MYRFLFRFFVITVTILTANLLTTALSDYLTSYRNQLKPVVFTFAAMGVIVVVFYPLFTRMEEWVKRISTRFMKSGKNIAGKYLGLILAFVFATMVLFYFYSKMWYGIDFIKVLLAGNIGNYL